MFSHSNFTLNSMALLTVFNTSNFFYICDMSDNILIIGYFKMYFQFLKINHSFLRELFRFYKGYQCPIHYQGTTKAQSHYLYPPFSQIISSPALSSHHSPGINSCSSLETFITCHTDYTVSNKVAEKFKSAVTTSQELLIISH